ncbi:hypothetical protein LJC57_02590, partial [Parabacteroides sp. OttesenSCG-928-G07]|nr:hypothetical protein [Parabacteroides sp. OttesenSCG-928-G07]
FCYVEIAKLAKNDSILLFFEKVRVIEMIDFFKICQWFCLNAIKSSNALIHYYYALLCANVNYSNFNF